MNLRQPENASTHDAYRVAGRMADLLNRVEREKRAMTMDERVYFEKLDAELTKIVSRMRLIQQ